MCLAVPGQVIGINDATDPIFRTGRVSFGGIIKEVNLAYVPVVKVGDYVLVHVGFALNIVDEHEAQATLRNLAGLGELDELRGKVDSA